MIVLPAMPVEQTASWLGVLDLFERQPSGWTLIGGQLVHLYCAERGQFASRPTNDIDTVIDVRADPRMLESITTTLVGLGFEADGISADGAQHRWKRGAASIDVLIPEGAGERTGQRQGVTGSRTVPTAGGTQALQRSEKVAVSLSGREGHILRPTLLGALVVKAATLSNPSDPGKARHRLDFATLARLLTAGDIDRALLTSKDRSRLMAMITAVRSDEALQLEHPESVDAMLRLEMAIDRR